MQRPQLPEAARLPTPSLMPGEGWPSRKLIVRPGMSHRMTTERFLLRSVIERGVGGEDIDSMGRTQKLSKMFAYLNTVP